MAGIIAFYGMNGLRLTLNNDEAYTLVMDVAQGHLDEVSDIAGVLRNSTGAR